MQVHQLCGGRGWHTELGGNRRCIELNAIIECIGSRRGRRVGSEEVFNLFIIVLLVMIMRKVTETETHCWSKTTPFRIPQMAEALGRLGSTIRHHRIPDQPNSYYQGVRGLHDIPQIQGICKHRPLIVDRAEVGVGCVLQLPMQGEIPAGWSDSQRLPCHGNIRGLWVSCRRKFRRNFWVITLHPSNSEWITAV